jgi:ectoine hydroxylase-related dioxygenase (phytanoyl-CoA dioxygenase family)
VRAGRFVGSIKRAAGEGRGERGERGEKAESDGSLALHADQNWMPTPFPEHNLVMTFCFACEGMTEAGGATCVVPGSHRLRRPPTPEDTEAATPVAVETEKGDVAVWDGAVWHGSLPRTIPGTRTVLHATYQRLYTQPIDDFTYLLKDEAYMASAPEGMRQLLGAELFFHTATPEHDVDMRKFMYAAAAAKI